MWTHGQDEKHPHKAMNIMRSCLWFSTTTLASATLSSSYLSEATDLLRLISGKLRNQHLSHLSAYMRVRNESTKLFFSMTLRHCIIYHSHAGCSAIDRKDGPSTRRHLGPKQLVG